MKEKQEGRFIGPLLVPLSSSLMQLEAFSVVKVIYSRGVKRAGRAYMNINF